MEYNLIVNSIIWRCFKTWDMKQEENPRMPMLFCMGNAREVRTNLAWGPWRFTSDVSKRDLDTPNILNINIE